MTCFYYKVSQREGSFFTPRKWSSIRQLDLSVEMWVRVCRFQSKLLANEEKPSHPRSQDQCSPTLKENESLHEDLFCCQVHPKLFSLSCSKNFPRCSRHQSSRPRNHFPLARELALQVIGVIQAVPRRALCRLPADVAQGSPDWPSFPWQPSCFSFWGLTVSVWRADVLERVIFLS